MEFEPGLDSFTEQLQDLKGAQARVYLMYARYVYFHYRCRAPSFPLSTF